MPKTLATRLANHIERRIQTLRAEEEEVNELREFAVLLKKKYGMDASTVLEGGAERNRRIEARIEELTLIQDIIDSYGMDGS